MTIINRNKMKRKKILISKKIKETKREGQPKGTKVPKGQNSEGQDSEGTEKEGEEKNSSSTQAK